MAPSDLTTPVGPMTRSTGVATRLAIGVLAVITMLGASAALSPSQAQPAFAPEGKGLSTLGACVNANGTLLVDVLVDTSGSLEQTDRDNLRVPALRAALGSLLSLTRSGGTNRAPTTVEVQLSSFDATYTSGGGFVALTSDSISGLLAATDSFSTRNQGLETDYVLALRGAQDSLAARSAELTTNGGQVCRAILWFTDGEYAIGNAAPGTKDYAPPGANPDAVTAAGFDALCRPGGIADQLRSSETVNVAVALTGETEPPIDLALLRAIVLGELSCGDVANPANYGVVLDVADVNQLTSGMLAAISGTNGISQTSGQVCDGAPCGRRVEIEVPDGVGSFYLLATTPASSAQRWLQVPGGEPVQLEPGAGPVSLGTSTVEPLVISASTVMVDVALDPSSPDTGTWAVDFVDPTGGSNGELGEVEVYLFGALRPDLVGDARFQQGDSSTLEVQVVDGNGEPVGGTLAQQTTLAVTVVDPVTSVVSTPTATGPDADGIYRFDFVAPSDSTAAALNVSLALSVVIDDGPALRPVVVEYAVPVAVPTVVPELVSGALTLGSVEGDATASGTLRVTGPERGEGRACVAGWDSRLVPDGVGSTDLATGTSCVTVAAGATADLPVGIQPAAPGTGTARGVLEVSLESADGAEQTIRSVPVSFDMLLAPNRPVQAALTALFALLGVGVPLALFWLVSRMTTTFRGLNSLQWAEVPVRVDGAGVRRVRDGDPTPLELKPMDWRHVGGNTARSFTAGNTGGLEVAVLHRTFSLSDATVRAAGADAVGSAGHRRRGGQFEAVVPLELTESWALVVDTVTFDETAGDGLPPYEVSGRLVAFMDDRHEWVARSEQLCAQASALAAEAIRPVVEHWWRDESRRRARPAAGEAADSSVSVGATVGPDPGAGAVPPWATGSSGAGTAAPPDAPPAPPWQTRSGDAPSGDVPPQRPW